ncbi:MAG: hypothetical protein MUF45_15325 [Spirosomaceae bacterium]|jgi:hypothetical protein|nr:hypothetical protein [Spirosomataceae bacterium]
MEMLRTPLTEPQLELLQMFTRPVSDSDWLAIKRMITNYFASKSIEEADKVWDEQGWDDAKIDELLNSHLRTPYNKS